MRPAPGSRRVTAASPLSSAEKSNRGTEIRIKLKEDASEFASTWRLESIIKKHSDYVSFPIYVVGKEGEEKMANRRTALWRQIAIQRRTGAVRRILQATDLRRPRPAAARAHGGRRAGQRAQHSLCPIQSANAAHCACGLILACASTRAKILIQEHSKDLLPEYLRFVEGVVDSEDLPLNVSRETVQSNPVMRQLKRALTNRLTKDLKALAESRTNAKYAAFWTEFGVFIKEGVATDYASQESLVELLRFRSSKISGG